jgi:hypothetical protein
MSTSIAKVLSWFLGILMFMFGFLKFFQPFYGWFNVQIQQSHLPHSAILMGKLGEMATGTLFLLSRLWRSLPGRSRANVALTACFGLVVEMLVAIYVHLQPQVPAAALPLGIKPPVIPLFVLVLGVIAAAAVWREARTEAAINQRVGIRNEKLIR